MSNDRDLGEGRLYQLHPSRALGLLRPRPGNGRPSAIPVWPKDRSLSRNLGGPCRLRPSGINGRFFSQPRVRSNPEPPSAHGGTDKLFVMLMNHEWAVPALHGDLVLILKHRQTIRNVTMAQRVL